MVSCVVFAFTPIVWFAGVRPMSDAAGVFFGSNSARAPRLGS
jgi:hypothetical protein